MGLLRAPILRHDQLIGKADLTADRKAGALRVNAIHQDSPFTPAMTDAVKAEIVDLASWPELGIAVP